MARLARLTKLSEQLVLHFAREIVSGRLPAGTPLPSEPELAARFEVSKVVVRECIQTLAALGMLRVQQGKRSTVLGSDDWNILAPTLLQALRQEGRTEELMRQLYELRLVLETHAAAEAARRIGQWDVSEFQEIVERMTAVASESHDVQTFLELDLRFHNAVVSAGGNVLLRAVMRDLHGFLLTCWSDSRIDAGQLETLAKQHTLIAQTIIRKQPEQAREAMQKHLRWAQATELGTLRPVGGDHSRS